MVDHVDESIVELTANVVQAGLTIRDMLKRYQDLMEEVNVFYDKAHDSLRPSVEKNFQKIFTGSMELKIIDSVCLADDKLQEDLLHALDLIDQEIADVHHLDFLNSRILLEFTRAFKKCFRVQSKELARQILAVKDLLEGIRSESIDALLSSGTLDQINKVSPEQIKADIVKKLQRMNDKQKLDFKSDLEQLQLKGAAKMIEIKALPQPRTNLQLPAHGDED